MFNLLIVDDEPVIVDGLALLDWESLDINKVYKATSGIQAISVIKENRIDIVITDIRMPDMSGLELIELVNDETLRKFIILSGYAEFEYAKQAIQLSVCKYLLKPVSDNEIMDAVSDASQSIRNNRRFFVEIMDEMPLIEANMEVIPFDILYDKPQLIDLLNYGNWQEAEDKLKEIFQLLEVERYQSHEFLLQAYFMICNTFTHYSHKNGYFLTDIIGNQIQQMHEAAYNGSIHQLEKVALNIFEKIKTNFKKDPLNSHQPIVEQVNQYINKNIYRDISLQEVADHVYLHPAYLSKIYKAETGKSFSDFVFNRKMEEAAIRLRKSNEKVYKIASGIGYKDPSYFIKKFKEYHGVTPQEYRLYI
ncbi:YesN/AraC family two-component response regulator [Gracilibacillus halotolerans]|uniref:YesN/AraC family two-component response regulator n=1 Tax=Gracilibacillus halotolerans TaxID=74386 RepID=A0A841RJZ3_9BACI|nr:response regulator [Gracilibacillus halotolerans]MBB6513021.1 YesN/AraC family two-component response regulator [Gracilibacillus halotolerans]